MRNCDGLGLGARLCFGVCFGGAVWWCFGVLRASLNHGPGQSEPRTGPVLEQNSASLKATLAQFEGQTRPA